MKKLWKITAPLFVILFAIMIIMMPIKWVFGLGFYYGDDNIVFKWIEDHWDLAAWW